MTIYSKKNLPKGFYVYAYVNKNGEPYYIGKGYGDRAWSHHDVKIPSNNNIIICESNLSEIGALALERRLIEWHGRWYLNTGILRNKTAGGDGSLCKKELEKSNDNDTDDDLNNIMRPLCKSCNINFCAINYKKNTITHYRSVCQTCIRKKKNLPPCKPKWMSSGYKKKTICDYCGFRSLYSSQMTVFHVNGNLEDTKLSNLKTICLNCIEIIKRREVNWKRGDLQIDIIK